MAFRNNKTITIIINDPGNGCAIKIPRVIAIETIALLCNFCVWALARLWYRFDSNNAVRFKRRRRRRQ